jgi:nitrogen fixation protein NifU and related proteins
MPSERLLDHFRNPRNVGDLAEPALRVEVVNPACGDILRLSATVDAGRVLEVRYKARGCPASIAAGSALTELIRGRSGTELRAIRAQDVEAAVGGLEPASKHAAQLCVDALSALAAKCDLK